MASEHKPFIIEFVGLPGAGKTTVAREVVRSLTAAGHSCPALDDKYRVGGGGGHLLGWGFRRWKIFLYCCRSVPTFLDLRKYVVGNSVSGMRVDSRFRLSLFKTLVYLRLAASSRHELVVLDQGLVQTIWSIAISLDGFTRKTLEEVFEICRDLLPDAIVWSQVDCDTALSRMEKRLSMDSRLERYSAVERRRMLEYQRENMAKIISWCSEFLCIPVCYVDGSRPIIDTVGEISGCIEKFIRQ